MKMKRLIAFILSAAMLIPSAAMAAGNEAEEWEYSGEYQAFDQITDYISQLYIEEYDKDEIKAKGLSELLSNNDELLVQLLKATLESLDDYSEFFTEEEYKQFDDYINHTKYGIGIIMHETEDGTIEVADFAEGNENAMKAGIKIGDKLIKIDGEDVTGLGMAAVRERVLGDEGTNVLVTVLRNGEEYDIPVTRGVSINAGTVSVGILEDNIGYIRIVTFGTDTAKEFESALDYMRENSVKKIILDLRDNGGGIVPVAIQIAQMIVPKGKIIEVKYRNSKDDATYTSTLTKKEFEFALLVNENTASSSEILASAMQDSKAATLIGTTTFGKAVIQQSYPLQNGAVFKLTVGKYITRNGKEINKKGLTPDVYVENETTKLDLSGYTQFDYGKNISLGQKSDNVLAAKERLAIMGLYAGEKNDIFDMELYDAVKAFQSMNGIFAYGVLDAPTQKLMDDVISGYDVMNDKQIEAAYKKLGGNPENLYN